MISVSKRFSGIDIIRVNTVPSETIPVNSKLLNQEYLVIVNSGKDSIRLTNWQVSNNTTDGWYRELYRFPEKLSDKKKWWFAPDELIFLFTGAGADKFIAKNASFKPQFHFHINRNEFLWNISDSVATLWDETTNKISSLSVHDVTNAVVDSLQ